MASNNESRKRKRVTFEEDTEVLSKRGRVDGRDTEDDRRPSSSGANEGLGHGLREHDASAGRVGEGMGDESRASRREGSGPVRPPLQRSNVADQTQRGTHDRDEGSGGRDAGHTRDGQHREHVGGEPSGTSSPPFDEQLARVHSRIMALADERFSAGGANQERDAATGRLTDVTLVTNEGGSNVWSTLGPYNHGPLGLRLAMSVAQLYTGDVDNPDLLYPFLAHNMAFEAALTHSPSGLVFTKHSPVIGEMAAPEASVGPTRVIPVESAVANRTGAGSRDGHLTEPREPSHLTCDVCHHDGTHSTGRCAMVTSDKHGDTNTDPFCDCSSSRARDRYGEATHGLQRSHGSGPESVRIVCDKLAAHWEQLQLPVLFEKFVVERRRMAPLLVYTEDFCFVRLAIAYSFAFCRGEMPEAMEGIWPYTKADAIRYKDQLRRFYEIGMENMPKGELESLSMAQIRARYNIRGGIPPQCRHQT